MTLIETRPDDDPSFIAFVEATLKRAIALAPHGIYVTRVDGWFGERWVGFSGKISGAAGVHFRSDFHVPPFVPNRIVSSKFLERNALGEYVFSDPPLRLHIRQASQSNFRRKLSEIAPNDALLWFSSGSKTSHRGTVMAYAPSPEGHQPWFLELAARDNWKVVKALGLPATALSVASASD